MLIIDFLILLMGLFLVVKGADILISSAVAIGKKYGVSDFFIGLIVIGFGTSLPELLVSIDAIIKNSPEISIGNVLGSNISNILLVLGCALIISKIDLSGISPIEVFDIPSIGAQNIRSSDTIDFRPRVVSPYAGSISPFVYQSRNFDVSTNPQVITTPNESSILGYKYYLPRIDKVILDPQGNLFVL